MEVLDNAKIITFPNTRSVKHRQRFLNKVSRWLVSRYAVTIDYIESYHVPPGMFSQMSASNYVIERKQILLPVYDEKLFLGSLVLRPLKDFKKENVRTVLELIHGIVSPFLVQLYRSEQIRLKESRMAPTINEGATLSLFRPNIRPVREEPTTPPKPLLIEGPNRQAIHRQALESHEEQRGQFFVSFEQIDPKKRLLSQELRNLGRITIFVNELLDYQRQDLGAILDLIRNNSPFDPNFPFLALGTTRDFAVAERQLQLSSLEAELISANSIYLSP